jgi:hypothetical protein
MSTPSEPWKSPDDPKPKPQPSPSGSSDPVPPAAPPYAYNPAPPGQPQQPPIHPGPQAYPPYYYGPPPQRTNGLAVASMVLGILCVYWIGSILALIFGYVARQQIRERNERGDGMAIAGIVLGWCWIGVLVIVIVAFAGSSGS